MKSEPNVEGGDDANKAQELRTLRGQLDYLRERYGEVGWNWPQVAGRSSEDELSRLRRELSAVQRDARSQVGDLTRGIRSHDRPGTSDEHIRCATGYGTSANCSMPSMREICHSS